MHTSHYVEGTELHLCDLDPKVNVIGKKAGICDGVPSTAALVSPFFLSLLFLSSPFKHTNFVLNYLEQASKGYPFKNIQSNLGYPNVNYPKLLGYSKMTHSPNFFLYYLLQ